jgi:uncharacterized peroxidase-related enzyme
MAIIRTTTEREAEGLVAELYHDDVRSLGHVATHTRVMAVNAEAVVAFEGLVRAVVAQLGLRRYELVTLAAATGTGSAHCRLAHGSRMLSLGLATEAELEIVARDHREAGRTGILSPAEVAMMTFAETVSTHPAAMTDADSIVLREHGFSDREIVDITLAAAVRNYYSTALQALAVDVDVPEQLSPDLRAALVQGL